MVDSISDKSTVDRCYDASKEPLFDAIKLIVMNVHYHHCSAKMTPIDELHISPHSNTIIEIKKMLQLIQIEKNQK